jgi:hypothetical protein
MIESILTSIKKDLGLTKEDESFDPEIVQHINSALFVLNQNGVGPDEGFSITGSAETWTDFIGDAPNNMEAVKTYVYLSVKLDFDPPEGSARLAAMERRKQEYEWRLNIQAETLT